MTGTTRRGAVGRRCTSTHARPRCRRRPRTHEAGERGDAVGASIQWRDDDRVGDRARRPGTSTTSGVGERVVQAAKTSVGSSSPSRRVRSSARCRRRSPTSTVRDGRRRRRPWRRGPSVAVARPVGIAVGAGGAERERVEVELVDAAVAPHLLVGAWAAAAGEALGGRAAQPGSHSGPSRAATASGEKVLRRRTSQIGRLSACGGRCACSRPRPAACSASTSARICGPAALTMSSASSSSAATSRRRGRARRAARRASAG